MNTPKTVEFFSVSDLAETLRNAEAAHREYELNEPTRIKQEWPLYYATWIMEHEGMEVRKDKLPYLGTENKDLTF